MNIFQKLAIGLKLSASDGDFVMPDDIIFYYHDMGQGETQLAIGYVEFITDDDPMGSGEIVAYITGMGHHPGFNQLICGMGFDSPALYRADYVPANRAVALILRP